MSAQGTILLADDEETFLKATQTLLQDEGYECHTVGDAKALSLALHGNAYDLLITDLNMPGNRVMEMVDEIQTQSKLLPVIVVTGYPSIATAVDSVRLNVLEYLLKPIDFPALLTSVKKGIEYRKRLQSARALGQVARERLGELENLEEAIQSFRGAREDRLSDIPITLFGIESLQSQISEVLELLREQVGSPDVRETGEPGHSQSTMVEDYFRLREGLHEAIQVLQRTKGSFRSKELANLRLYLQDLLKTTKPNS